ncbi:MAG: alpha/beta hydrolase [Spirochaetia bacterium]|nr:alpha/beta hydrolase [Spirochaetia bacterium]
MDVIFKNKESREKINDWHNRFREKIKYPTESKYIETSFGKTHLLIGGQKNLPPLVLLHAAMTSSSHVLSEFSDLMKNFRVYAIDIIGQSVKSEDSKISVKNNNYGKWLLEVLDAYKLNKVNIVGVSWGGFIGIRTAIIAPERINKMFLLVPAGLVNGSPWDGLRKMILPLYLYQKNQTPKRLNSFAKNLITTMTDDWLPYIADSVLAYKTNMSIPSLVKEKELENYKAPTFVVGAELDVSFPGEKLINRSKKVFKNLINAELIKNSLHCPPTTDEFRKWLIKEILNFLA